MSERTVTVLDAVDLRGATIGRVAGQDGQGRPLVTWPGREGPPCRAEVLAGGEAVDWSGCRGARALLALAEDAAGVVPVLVGLLEPAPGAGAPERAAAPAAGDTVPQEVRIEGEREIVLKCGAASIALRADGRIVIRGGYILSRSSGAQKIKGATVQIN